ncbi:hypothetical protein PHYC_03690 [Phycisphaerales bacterium]|nr:hypothetical protein PHYC_03690 [Phycisphaerales bacterium]
MFFDAFANAQPAADLNLDNQVDVTDAEVFLNSFANENP